MGPDPRLPPMPDKPTLLDFFNHRFASAIHLLQSATLALKNGHSEKIIMACLLHDIGVVGFIRCDHGYWGAQLIEPYVDEEVSWAIRVSPGAALLPRRVGRLRLSRACTSGSSAPTTARAVHRADYKRARNHKWYMTAG